MKICLGWTLLLCFCGFLEVDSSRSLTVVTYNLWNIMFNWDIRRIRIAQMVIKQVLAINVILSLIQVDSLIQAAVNMCIAVIG